MCRNRIRRTIDAPESVVAARAHEGLIRSETRALEVVYGRLSGGWVARRGSMQVGVGLVVESAGTDCLIS
jgi:hypothetical protein